jgi:hypothetical protein
MGGIPAMVSALIEDAEMQLKTSLESATGKPQNSGSWMQIYKGASITSHIVLGRLSK